MAPTSRTWAPGPESRGLGGGRRRLPPWPGPVTPANGQYVMIHSPDQCPQVPHLDIRKLALQVRGSWARGPPSWLRALRPGPGAFRPRAYPLPLPDGSGPRLVAGPCSGTPWVAPSCHHRNGGMEIYFSLACRIMCRLPPGTHSRWDPRSTPWLGCCFFGVLARMLWDSGLSPALMIAFSGRANACAAAARPAPPPFL